MFKDSPALLLAITVSMYWATVLLLSRLHRRWHGRSAGLVPRQRDERRLWLLLMPVLAGWVVLPYVVPGSHQAWLRLPHWAHEPWAIGVRFTAAGVALACYLASIHCWRRMGREWTMAIVPGQTSRIVTTGFYAWARHPIYALQVAMMGATVVVLPVPVFGVLAVAHCLVMNRKAAYEERHLTARFGDTYRDYSVRVGRFFPRWARHAG